MCFYFDSKKNTLEKYLEKLADLTSVFTKQNW
jgi:hypothetical protein